MSQTQDYKCLWVFVCRFISFVLTSCLFCSVVLVRYKYFKEGQCCLLMRSSRKVFLSSYFTLREYGVRINILSGPPSARRRNAISMTFRWWADDGELFQERGRGSRPQSPTPHPRIPADNLCKQLPNAT